MSGDRHHWGVGHVGQHHVCKDLGFDKPRPWPLLNDRKARSQCRSAHLRLRRRLVLLLGAQQLVLILNLVAHILPALTLSHPLRMSELHLL